MNPRCAMAWLLILLGPAVVPAQVVLTPDGPVNPEMQKRRAQTAPDQPETIELTITPAAEPDPALKYVWAFADHRQGTGNAAIYYYRAFLAYSDPPRRGDDPFHANMESWLEGPLAELPHEQVRQYVAGYRHVFEELEIAAQRPQCDWDWHFGQLEGPEVINFRIREVQLSRDVARLLALRARLEIADQRYAEAARTIGMGFKMGHDIAQGPTLIDDLVGVAIESMLMRQLRELIDAEGSPNMYWTLASLPDPLDAFRHSLRYELSLPVRVFPFLRNPEAAIHSPEQWRQLFAEAANTLEEVAGPGQQETSPLSEYLNEAALTASALRLYPEARNELLRLGYDEQQVEAMSVGQALAIHQSRVYRQVYQELYRWLFVPPQQARGRIRQSEQHLHHLLHAPGAKEVLPIAALLLPPMESAHQASLRSQVARRALMTVEAIRMHAAQSGQLPSSLDEIDAIPVPANPWTGSPFPYRLEGDHAVLEIRADPHEWGHLDWQFVLRLSEEGTAAKR